MRISDILKLFKKKTICYYCHIEIKDNQRKEFAHFTIGLFGKVIPSDWMHVWCYCKYFDANYKDFIDKKLQKWNF